MWQSFFQLVGHLAQQIGRHGAEAVYVLDDGHHVVVAADQPGAQLRRVQRRGVLA